MRELLSNNSLFVGKLYEDKSLALRARDLTFLQLTSSDLLLNNSLLELIYFLNNIIEATHESLLLIALSINEGSGEPVRNAQTRQSLRCSHLPESFGWTLR